jgi:DNA-binding MarR family transcriptional regulator
VTRAPKTRTAAPSDFLLEDFLPYRLWVASEVVSRTFAQLYERRFGISISEWRVLATLGDGRTETTQRVIERSHLDRVRVSRALIRLADKGLVDRCPQLGDQRAHVLQLSRRGLSVYGEIAAQAHRLQTELVASLNTEERASFRSLIERIERAAETLGQDYAADDAP